MGLPGEAIYNFKEADRLLRILCKELSTDYLGNYAANCVETGKCYRMLNQHDKEFEKTKLGVDYFRILAKHNPDAYLIKFEEALNSLGNCYRMIGREEEAIKITEESASVRWDIEFN
jgi:tetratricopeptide (TPR) repeat protein